MAASPAPPPLTLSLSTLRPHTLFLAPPSPPLPLPLSPLPLPTPGSDVLSPSHNHPGPFGTMSLGAELVAHLRLVNTSGGAVEGVRMMCEVQGPGGRYQLGEAVHGESTDSEEKPQDVSGQPGSPPSENSKENGEADEPTDAAKTGDEQQKPIAHLRPDEVLSLDCSTEVKETGLHILICSVAWETPDGRRTFQRFLKFNVSPPLAIKTRIVAPSSANALMDKAQREEIYLEILTTNTSPEGIRFERVGLEAVAGLESTSIAETEIATLAGPSRRPSHPTPSEDEPTLMPGDTRQYLFLLTPSSTPPSLARRGSKSEQLDAALPRSIFPPSHPAGTILPLGRLDVAWLSGQHHDPGRLQTSTLNRRVPVTSSSASASSITQPALGPTRTSSALPASPAQIARVPSPRPPPLPSKQDKRMWEYDLVVLDAKRSGVALESQFSITLRLAVRSVDQVTDGQSAPIAPRLGIQHLTLPTPPPPIPVPGTAPLTSYPQVFSPGQQHTSPDVVLSPPSRGTTPFSPPTSYPSTPTGVGASGSRTLSPPVESVRPRTPLAAQLKQAATSGLGHTAPAVSAAPELQLTAVEFPPLPYFNKPPKGLNAEYNTLRGQVTLLGSTLQLIQPIELRQVQENQGVVYGEMPAARTLWEGQTEVELRFIALEPGLAELGGVRLLFMQDETGLQGEVEREWESLGDVWIPG